ncbi:hypothetical protein [Microbacterium sp. Leaf320]|uniref:hypothetical protein n=1 Tax=Microbacterium sp. Leaf320 TaxID=1736334 RepID=UPI0006F35083|nr:hypothetical protein [Microbacterium sp. Leaf320]KQQ65335.1 hypothetical protein ASF63_15450 [Microbacterium sp. Leaf320]
MTRQTWRILGWVSAALATTGGALFLFGAYRQTALTSVGFLLVLIGVTGMLSLLIAAMRRTHPPKESTALTDQAPHDHLPNEQCPDAESSIPRQ